MLAITMCALVLAEVTAVKGLNVKAQYCLGLAALSYVEVMVVGALDLVQVTAVVQA